MSDQKPKIFHVSYSDIGGGAARSAFRLHRGLKGIEVESSMLVGHKLSSDATVRVIARKPRGFVDRLLDFLRRRGLKWPEAHRLQEYLATRPPPFEIFSDDRALFCIELRETDIVVNLHWVAGLVDYSSFFRGLPRSIPIVWTLHDMNPFTGGCHYDNGCGRFSNHCGACPQLGSSDPTDFSYESWHRRDKALSLMAPSTLNIVCPSQWLAHEARKSSLFRGFPVSVIPYGIETDEFCPLDKGICKQALGLEVDDRTVLFVADNVNNARKGLDLLVESIRLLPADPRLIMLTLGKSMPKLNIETRHVHLGHVSKNRLLATVFNAAEVFVCPSRQDNLPNTILEALSCGTPVVGFNVGGIPDMVREGLTGATAAAEDTRGLATSISEILDLSQEEKAKMAYRCRRLVLDEYSLHLQAERYLALYENLLNERRRGATPKRCMSRQVPPNKKRNLRC